MHILLTALNPGPLYCRRGGEEVAGTFQRSAVSLGQKLASAPG